MFGGYIDITSFPSLTTFIKCSNNHYSHKECIANTFKQECPVCRVTLAVDDATSTRIAQNAENVNAQWDAEAEQNIRNMYSNYAGGSTSYLDTLLNTLTQNLSTQTMVADTRQRIIGEFNSIAQHIPIEKVKELLIEKIRNGWSEAQLRNLLADDHYQHLIGTSARSSTTSSSRARGRSTNYFS